MTNTLRSNLKLIAASLLALLLAALPVSLLAQPGAGHGLHRGGPGLEFLARELELSDGQSEEVRAILESQRSELAPPLESLASAHKALEYQIHEAAFDEAAIRLAVAAVAAVEADLAVSRAAAAQEIRGVLTPEQWEQLEQLRSERRKRFGEGGRRFGSRPGGRD